MGSTDEKKPVKSQYIKYIAQEIARLQKSALEQKNFKVRFNNPDLEKCWEVKQCNNTKCPAYKNPDQRCWHVTGTFCKGDVQGKFAQKIASCKKCEVYQKAVATELYAIGEAFNDMMQLLQEDYEQLQHYAQDLEEKVKDRTVELERSNQELQQFAYSASHDLQEPLRMVTNYTQLLARRYKGKLDADADEFIDFAVDGAKRMRELINDLLAYSCIDTKGAEFELTDCSVILNNTLTSLQAVIENSGAVVTYDVLSTLMADGAQLGQLFKNLIGNAIKFRGEERPKVHIGVKEGDKEWVFFVRDNGIGIDLEYADKIFVIFKRLNSRTAYPGTGIGLAICKKIVERHGGSIWIEPAPKKGTVFYFSIPKADKKGLTAVLDDRGPKK